MDQRLNDLKLAPEASRAMSAVSTNPKRIPFEPQGIQA